MTDMASEDPTQVWATASRTFVREVRRRCQDNGSRAALRRSRGRQTHRLPPEVFKTVEAAMAVAEKAGGYTDTPKYISRDGWNFACYTVAAIVAEQEHLFPTEQAADDEALDSTTENQPDTNDPVGADPTAPTPGASRKVLTLTKALGYAASQGDLNEETTTRRLHSLVRSRPETLARQIPPLADRLITARRDVDWARLLIDLARWDDHRPQIATGWLRDYHRALLSTDTSRPDLDAPSTPENPETPDSESDPT